ncbi:hypothetical protein AGMMS4957_15640 [Bacteroidia bacterium]|nr:hypothetical protein AGMMS4957_15640 [Bacteroidia bacterium]
MNDIQFRYNAIEGMGLLGGLYELSTKSEEERLNVYCDYAIGRKSINFENWNKDAEPFDIGNGAVSNANCNKRENLKPTKFYCKLILGESGNLYIYRKIAVEQEKISIFHGGGTTKGKNNLDTTRRGTPLCGDPLETILKGTIHNYEREKNIEQKQWLLSVPELQKANYKDYIVTRESCSAIIKKFKRTYQNISHEKAREIIGNNKHIKDKEKQNIGTLIDSMVMTFLYSPNLEYIEYSELRDEKRILIRDDSTIITIVDEKNERVYNCNLCIVFNLERQRIITSYFNEINDKHNTRNKLKLENATAFEALFDEKTGDLKVQTKETALSLALKSALNQDTLCAKKIKI